MQFITKTLLYLSYFSVLIPLFFLFGGKFSSTTKVIKALSLLLFVAGFADLMGYIVIKTMGSSNIIIDNIYFITTFYLLNYIYSLILKNKTLIYVGLISYTGLLLLDSLFIEPITGLQTWPLVLENAFLITYGMMGLIQLLKNPPEDDHQTSLYLWINLAVLFYFGMNLYLFITIDYILENKSTDIAMISWSFHNVCNIIKNIFFAAGIYYAGMKAGKIAGVKS